MRKQIFAIASILSSTLIFLMGNGLLGTLIPVRARLEGFSDLAIGLIGSAYFVGFVIGCYAGPRLLARAGHSRIFAVGAGTAAAATLLQSLAIEEFTWVVMRCLFGFAAALLYMVIESWLNDRATNDTRGRIFSAYLTVNFGGLIIGQWFYSLGKPASFTLFVISGVFYALCLIPMGLTRLPQPAPAEVPTLRPMRLFRISPVGVMGCIAVGFSNGAVWTFAPVYAQDVGLTRGLLAAFMIAFTLGGALVQVPLGRLSDRMDRRYILAAVSALAAGLGIALYLFGSGAHVWLTLGIAALFGMVALPVYGISIAHTNDRLPREMFVEASATLLMINALASVIGPIIAALVTARAGMPALFLYTATIHVALAVFTIVRIRIMDAPPNETRDPFMPVPQQASPTALELDPRGPEAVESVEPSEAA